jgi:hypothetical protein
MPIGIPNHAYVAGIVWLMAPLPERFARGFPRAHLRGNCCVAAVNLIKKVAAPGRLAY